MVQKSTAPLPKKIESILVLLDSGSIGIAHARVLIKDVWDEQLKMAEGHAKDKIKDQITDKYHSQPDGVLVLPCIGDGCRACTETAQVVAEERERLLNVIGRRSL